MTKLKRDFPINQEAIARLQKAPNLCGMGDRTYGECRDATVELFTLAVNHGYRDGVLKVAMDVLTFLSKSKEYSVEWGDCKPISGLLAYLIDAIDRKDSAAIEAAIAALGGQQAEKKERDRP